VYVKKSNASINVNGKNDKSRVSNKNDSDLTGY